MGARAASLASIGGTSWKIAGVGDYKPDGKADVAWANAVTGQSVIWGAGNSAQPIALVGVADPAWTNP